MNASSFYHVFLALLAQSFIGLSTGNWWDRASNFKRLNPMVVALGAALGKTDEELDGLWALAGTLG